MPPRNIHRSSYYAGAQRIATRVSGDPTSANNGVFWALTDHLGSTAVTLNSSAQKVADIRYDPWGKPRSGATGYTPTDRRYTGQIYDDLTSLYFYNARYYDPALSRFIQADTLVPDPASPQDFNRYSYVLNNPLKYTDPTGHCATHKAAGDGLYDDCKKQQRYLSDSFGIQFLHPDEWSFAELQILGGAFIKFKDYIGNEAWNYYFGRVALYLSNISFNGDYFDAGENRVNIDFWRLSESQWPLPDYEFTVAHELAHVLIFRMYRLGMDESPIALAYADAMDWSFDQANSKWRPSKNSTTYGRETAYPEQDFAEVLAALVVNRGPSFISGNRLRYEPITSIQRRWMKSFIYNLRDTQD